MNTYSPLRYPGSKRKLTNYISKILIRNNLTPKIIVEPFVGGGSVFLSFLAKKYVEKIVIADKDELISAFWKTLFFDTDYLINFIKTTPVTLKQFYYYKRVAKNPKNYSTRVRAKACLFLNRTSFSGILTTNAGPIGGKGQKSAYKVDCRFGRLNLVKKIENIAAFREKITLLSFDYLNTIKAFLKKFEYKENEVLFYFDPPFYKKADNLYRHYFNKNNHKKLSETLINLKQSWILSYDNALEIKRLYSEIKRIHVQIPYSINSPATRLEKELIITPLKLPKIG